MMATAPRHSADWASGLDFWRCTSCNSALAISDGQASLICRGCGQGFPIRDDVLVVKSEVTDNNKVAVDFYNSPLWPKFRFWEWFTFVCNGGERRSRDKVLRYLPKDPGLRLLDVAIGDGVYLDWLPKDWSVVGIDVSSSQLEACQKRAGSRDLKLVLGEAEDLPVRDGSFDAALSIGGFNYFNDPEKSLREMVRAVKPGGTIVVSDEIPTSPTGCSSARSACPASTAGSSRRDSSSGTTSPTWLSVTDRSTSRRSPSGFSPGAAMRRSGWASAT